jgi:hypothetical protein
LKPLSPKSAIAELDTVGSRTGKQTWPIIRADLKHWPATDVAINGNYPTPVTVNGYACKNCTDVDNAKKHIDPAHPKDGPYGIAKANHGKTAAAAETSDAGSKDAASPVITFGGQLAGLAVTPHPDPAPRSVGARLDLSI